MEINDKNLKKNPLNWIYYTGFFIILILPLIAIPPYFSPPDWGKTIVFRSVLAILLFLFTYQVLYKKIDVNFDKIKKNIIVWALSALLLIYIIATLFSVDPYFSFWGNPYRGGGFITFAFYFVFAILTFLLFKKEGWKKAWDTSIIAGILVSLVGLMQYYGLFNLFLPVTQRPPSTMGNPDLLATYLLLLSFITLAFAIKETILWKKIYYFVSLGLFFYTLLITESRAAYAGITIGLVYFFIWYPIKNMHLDESALKKIRYAKIAIISILLLVVAMVFYTNTINQYPQFLQKNRLFNLITSRFSIESLKEDPRSAALHIELPMAFSRPLLGYGMENFSVGFDKYYNPAIPYINSDLDWWDRAHNILFQTISDAGFLGLIAYLALFTVLLWQLQKVTSGNKNNGKSNLMPHAIQATLIAYFINNLFSFDGFSSYLILFLLIGYSLYLIFENAPTNNPVTARKKSPWNPIIISLLFLILAVFLWQDNLVPTFINGEINKAADLAATGQCDKAFATMDNILPEHSFLDSYARLEYVELTKTCISIEPQNSQMYLQKGLQLITQALKIQPLYTRYWLYMASSTNDLAAQAQNPAVKNNLLNQGMYYENKALQLAPKHQEIIIEQAKTAMIAGNYRQMQQYSENCVALNSIFEDCYWYLGLSQIYQNNINDGKEDIQKANTYNVDSQASLSQLSDAYYYVKDYQDLISVYQRLIEINANVIQYYSSLAYFYKQLGQYQQARQEALKVLQLSPSSKQNVDAFLQTLPQ